MPTHSRKPKSTYSLTKLYDGRFCLVLAPSAPPPSSSMQETPRSSTSSTQSHSPASTHINQHQPAVQSMPASVSVSVSASTSTHLFQPYPSHFPWSRKIASIHRNLYLYKETQAEIIQRDKRIALREAAYTEFHTRMAEESRSNHVGVTTRSAAAAIRGEPTKRSSRAAARINDSVFDPLDDLDPPPRKKARTTTRTANNNNVSNNGNSSVQSTRNSNTNSNSEKNIKSVTTTPSGDRLTTRSQTRSRRTVRGSQTPLDGEIDPSAKGDINGDANETVSKSLDDAEPQSPETQQTVNTEELVSGHAQTSSIATQVKYPEETLSPELTPLTKLGRASSTSSTLASSRQSSDDGYRKSDLRFGDTQSLDGDVNAELGDAELPAAVNDATTSLTRQSTDPPQLCTTSDNLPACKMDDTVAKIADDNRPSQSPSPQLDATGIATKKTGRTKLHLKRSLSHSSNDDYGSENNVSVQLHEPEKEIGDGETNSVESNVVIPPEVRRSGRVLKKRKLE